MSEVLDFKTTKTTDCFCLLVVRWHPTGQDKVANEAKLNSSCCWEPTARGFNLRFELSFPVGSYDMPFLGDPLLGLYQILEPESRVP